MPNGDPNKDLKKLYDAVSEELDIGAWEEFPSKMDDVDKRKKFYDSISEDLDIGGYDEYESRLKKKGVSGDLQKDLQAISEYEEGLKGPIQIEVPSEEEELAKFQEFQQEQLELPAEVQPTGFDRGLAELKALEELREVNPQAAQKIEQEKLAEEAEEKKIEITRRQEKEEAEAELEVFKFSKNYRASVEEAHDMGFDNMPDYFKQFRGSASEEFLDLESGKEEFKIRTEIEDLQELKAQGGPVSDEDIKALEDQADSIKTQKYSDINRKIATLRDALSKGYTESMIGGKISRIERTPLTEDDRLELKEEIDFYKGLKQDVFETDPAKIASRAKETIDENPVIKTILARAIETMPKDLTGKERFDRYYNVLYKQYRDLAKKEGYDVEDGQIVDEGMISRLGLGIRSITGVMSEDEKKLIELHGTLRQLTPVYLLNQSPIKEKEGFWDVFWSNLGGRLGGVAAQVQIPREQEKAQTLQETFSAIGIKPGELKEGVEEAIQETGKDYGYEDWEDSKKSIAMLTSTITDIGIKYAIGAKVTGTAFKALGAIKGTKLGKSISSLSQEGKLGEMTIKFQKSLASKPGVTKFLTRGLEAGKHGIKGEVAGQIFRNDEEELNFQSMFLGHAVGKVIQGISAPMINKIYGMFGKATPKVVQTIEGYASRGLGELAEESMQELYQIYKATENGEEFLEELERRFGKTSDKMEFMISSILMGVVFHGTNTSHVQRFYDSEATPEERAMIDAITKEITDDIVQSSSEAVESVSAEVPVEGEKGPDIEQEPQIIKEDATETEKITPETEPLVSEATPKITKIIPSEEKKAADLEKIKQKEDAEKIKAEAVPEGEEVAVPEIAPKKKGTPGDIDEAHVKLEGRPAEVQGVFKDVFTAIEKDPGNVSLLYNMDLPAEYHLTQSEIRKAVTDIQEGKETVRASKLMNAIHDVSQKGVVPKYEGTGTMQQKFEVPFEEFTENIKQQQVISDINKTDLPSDLMDVIENETVLPFGDGIDGLIDRVQRGIEGQETGLNTFVKGKPILTTDQQQNFLNLLNGIKDGSIKVNTTEDGQFLNIERIDESGNRSVIYGEETAREVEAEPVKKPTEPEAVKKPAQKKIEKARGSPKEAQAQEAQAELAYGSLTQDTDRIPPAPISGEKSKPMEESISELATGINRIISYATPKRRKAAGTYTPASTVIKIRRSNNIDTIAHEVGHALDDQYGILKDIPAENETSIDKELAPFAVYGSKPPQKLSKEQKEKYVRAEGVAEWLRAYMVNPDVAIAKAPEMNKWFTEKVPKNTIAIIDKFGRDFRVFAGATAHEIIGKQVKFEYTAKKNPIAQLFRRGNTLDEKIFEITFADKLATNWTNRMHAFEKAFEFATGVKGMTEIMPKEDARILARTYLGINDKLGDMLKNGLVDVKNKRVIDNRTNEPMTLHWLLGSLDNTDLESLKQEQQEVITYMIAERTLELPKKFFIEKVEKDLKADKLPPDIVIEKYIGLKEFTEEEITVIDDTVERLKGKAIEPEPLSKYEQKGPVTGIGAGVFTEGSIAEKRLQDLREMSVDNPEKYNRITESARRYRVFADETLKYMVDKGRLAADQYAKIKETNTQYVALLRVMETAPNEEIEVFARGKGGSLGSVKKPIQKIKGSSRLIENPYASLLDYFYKGTTEADRNEVVKTFRDMLVGQREFYEGQPENLAQVGFEVKQSDKGQKQEIFIDGKPEYWRFQTDVHQAIKNISEMTAEVPLFLSALPSALRWTVTNFPVFGIRNTIRDTQNRLVVSEVGSGLRDFVGDKADVSKYKLFGGGQAGYYIKDKLNYYDMMETAMKELAKDKRFILLDPKRLKDKLWDKGYRRFIEGTEEVNRIAEWRKAYKVAKKKGMDDYNAQLFASFHARDLLDFAVAGHYMRYINKLIPFSNAAIQGLRKTLRTAKKDPKGFFVRWMLYSMVPAILNRVLIGMMGEDEEKQFQQFPAYQRDLFYNVPVAPNLWLSIPKPFELGVMGSGAERLADMMFYGNEDAFHGYLGSVARSTMPVDEAALAGPAQGIVQALANYDFFRQKNIVPPAEKKLRMELRNTDRGSRLGKLIQNVFGLDARTADFLIRSQTSYFGGLAIKLSDVGSENVMTKLGITDTGLFRRTPLYNSKNIQFILDFAAKNALTRSPDYIEFTELLSDYFDAPNDAESDRRAKEVMEYAKDLKSDWQQAEPEILEEQLERFNKEE